MPNNSRVYVQMPKQQTDAEILLINLVDAVRATLPDGWLTDEPESLSKSLRAAEKYLNRTEVLSEATV